MVVPAHHSKSTVYIPGMRESTVVVPAHHSKAQSTYLGCQNPQWWSQPTIARAQSTYLRCKNPQWWSQPTIARAQFTYLGCENPQWWSQPTIAGAQSMSSFLATLFKPSTERKQHYYSDVTFWLAVPVTAKLISAFVFATRIVHFLFLLNPKFQASMLLLGLYMSVCVRPGWKPRRPVFSRRGSNNFSTYSVDEQFLPVTWRVGITLHCRGHYGEPFPGEQTIH